jgi:hypothetical protein
MLGLPTQSIFFKKKPPKLPFNFQKIKNTLEQKVPPVRFFLLISRSSDDSSIRKA